MGALAAYFGAGKSRIVGMILMVAALIVGFVFGMLTFEFVPGVPVLWEPEVVGQALIAVFAATVGGIVSLVIFLLAIMRS